MAEEARHKLSLFGGITQNKDNSSEAGASISLGYTYRIDRLLGIGGFLEYAGGDIDEWVIGVPVIVFPWAEWFLLLAPGVEYESSETSAMLRIGTGYDFELSERWWLAPEFYVDLSRFSGTTWVYGLSISRSC